MDTKQHDLLVVDGITELAEICRRAGAAMSTAICSCERVVVYYKDPLTNGVLDADFVDELHIRHPGNACLLIAVFPVDNL